MSSRCCEKWFAYYYNIVHFRCTRLCSIRCSVLCPPSKCFIKSTAIGVPSNGTIPPAPATFPCQVTSSAPSSVSNTPVRASRSIPHTPGSVLNTVSSPNLLPSPILRLPSMPPIKVAFLKSAEKPCIPEVLGTLLFYARAIDSTLLTAIGELVTEQS
jgi:hypothetical protein